MSDRPTRPEPEDAAEPPTLNQTSIVTPDAVADRDNDPERDVNGYPREYVSIRLTLPHAMLEQIITALKEPVYCIYPHLGSTGENPHFHICVPVPNGDDVNKWNDKLRKRLKFALKIKGNSQLMIKSNNNGVHCFLQYAAREDTSPIHAGVNWPHWIEHAPKWKPKEQTLMTKTRGKPRDPDIPLQITYQNMKRLSLRHRLRFNLKSTDLTEILSHMITHGGYDFSISIYKGGIPATEHLHFTQMCHGYQDPHATTNWIRSLKYVPSWNGI